MARREPLPRADFYLWGYTNDAENSTILSCETCQAGTPEFAEMIRELEAFEAEIPVFTQNTSTWLLAWYQSRPQEILKLSLVKDASGVIAAFWHAERKMGPLQIIHSAPVGSCDFFDAPMSARASRKQVVSVLLNMLQQGRHDVILFKNVNSHSCIYQGLIDARAVVLASMRIHSRWLAEKAAPAERLNSKFRYSIRSKYKKIHGKWGAGAIVLRRIETFSQYAAREQAYADIFRERWGKNVAQDVSERRRRVLGSLLSTGEARVYEIQVAGKIAGYKIGFAHRNVFWEWKSCMKIEFNPYSLNDIFLAELMEKLRQEGVHAYNFMAGDYDYKRRWADVALQTKNYHFLIGNSALGKLVIPAIIFAKKIRDTFRKGELL